MLSEEAKLIAIVSNDQLPEKADAVICLESDGYIRADKSLKLFNEQKSRTIVVLGDEKIKKYLVGKGLHESNILFIKGPENKDERNTYTEAQEVMKEVKKNNWKNIIIVTSAFHQPRAFLTFLKEAKNSNLFDQVKIFNAPVYHSWFKSTIDTSVSRWDQFLGINGEKGEFNKIKEYDLVSIKEAIEYQKWKEKQT